MSQVHANPEEIRRFIGELKQFNERIGDEFGKLDMRFKRLGETWRDQEYAKFSEVFQQTFKMLNKLTAETTTYTSFLAKKAKALEIYRETR